MNILLIYILLSLVIQNVFKIYIILLYIMLCLLQWEKDYQEISFQFESMNERLEEADGLSSAQVSSIAMLVVHIK